MLWHVWGAPASSAGLIHEKPEKVTKSLAFFKKLALVMKRAGEIRTPVLVEILFDLGFQTPFMQWLQKALNTTEWTTVPDIVKVVLKEFWESPLNEKMIEDWNRFMREREQRNSLHKKVAIMECWRTGDDYDIMGQYKRKWRELMDHNSVSVPPKFDFEQLFRHHQVAEDATEEDCGGT